MFEVLEYAGMFNENEVTSFTTLEAAEEYVDKSYSTEEIRDMPVDITHNGSTEY